MTTSLNGKYYCLVLSAAGERIVLRQQRPGLWRLASLRETLRVLASLYAPMLRIVS